MKKAKGPTGKKKIGIARILFPLLTLLCLAGFIGSLIFPNEVLDTYKVNMSEEEGDETTLLPLSYVEPISYEIDTAGRAMKGVQLGISKRGQTQSGQILHYDVYAGGNKVSENVYDLSAGEDLQYVYLPFVNDTACSGSLRIELKLDAGAGELPEEERAALEANHRQIDGIETVLYEGAATSDPDAADPDATDPDAAGQGVPNLRGSHIYSHNTYPFLYDFRILTFVFLAVSMALPRRERRSA
ncbi:MAG: hypothetical protein K6E84_03610 [Lachnospiraceae bacterium]|nr:hypothetical protein [Lachnospiraceae bacterium]